MKTYLLIAGYNYYPDRGTGDWIGCFYSKEEANEKIDELKDADCDYEYDWYEIVNLKDWMCDDD